MTDTTSTSHAAWDALTLSIPAHWLPALANDDTTGLDDNEARAYSRWLYDTTNEIGYPCIVDISEEAHFARYHDAAEYGVLACMCHNVELTFTQERRT
jgi:hypothetical protein